jgi:hypothetical protein
MNNLKVIKTVCEKPHATYLIVIIKEQNQGTG